MNITTTGYETKSATDTRSQNVVLVHGAWQGAWIWDAASAALRMRGHCVHALDLPGSGSDTTPAGEVTLSSYAQRIADAIKAIGAPVTLVGHSMGGMAVAAAAELVPEQLTQLIYLCAFLPLDGDSLGALSALDDSKAPLRTELAPGSAAARLHQDDVASRLLHDCDPAVAAWAAPQFLPQPLQPLGTPIQLSGARYGRVARSYVVCTDDRAVSPALQRRMLERSPCRRVLELPTGHLPFLSDPWRVGKAIYELMQDLPH